MLNDDTLKNKCKKKQNKNISILCPFCNELVFAKHRPEKSELDINEWCECIKKSKVTKIEWAVLIHELWDILTIIKIKEKNEGE